MAVISMSISEVFRHANDSVEAGYELGIPSSSAVDSSAIVNVTIEQAVKLGILKSLYEHNC